MASRLELHRTALVTGLLVCGGLGCDAESGRAALGDTTPRVCEQASDEARACFGDEVAQSVLDGCDPVTAEHRLGLPCEQLATVMLDSKSDDPLAEAVRDAVMEALHQGIVAGLEAALQQLGLPTDEYVAHLMLDQAETEADAARLAESWRDALDGHPGFAPTVRAYDSGWAVVHAPCVIELGAVLPEFVADLVLGHADTITALGGTVDAEGNTSNVRLPLALLPQAADDATDPACD